MSFFEWFKDLMFHRWPSKNSAKNILLKNCKGYPFKQKTILDFVYTLNQDLVRCNQSSDRVERPLVSSSGISTWKPPTEGWIRINVDAVCLRVSSASEVALTAMTHDHLGFGKVWYLWLMMATCRDGGYLDRTLVSEKNLSPN